ncbi:MAG: hypothetical protein ACLQVD_21460 [Capsulimonadaceae bacterium]
MAALVGWNISELTGHADPVIGGMAYDARRGHLWITERGFCVIRIDVGSNSFKMYRCPAGEPSMYGPPVVLSDGSIFVADSDNRLLLHFDEETTPIRSIVHFPIVGLAAGGDSVWSLTDHGARFTVDRFDEAGRNRSSTPIAQGFSANYFQGHTPIFADDEKVIALLIQKSLECIILDREGTIRNNLPIALEGGYWEQEMMVYSPADQCVPTGRRYLLDATLNAKANSLVFLYAPPSGKYGLVVVDWPLDGTTPPTVYDLPLWVTRILWAGSRLACYGSEKFSGHKKIFPIALATLDKVPLVELPLLATAFRPMGGNVLEQLFSETPKPVSPDYRPF